MSEAEAVVDPDTEPDAEVVPDAEPLPEGEAVPVDGVVTEVAEEAVIDTAVSVVLEGATVLRVVGITVAVSVDKAVPLTLVVGITVAVAVSVDKAVPLTLVVGTTVAVAVSVDKAVPLTLVALDTKAVSVGVGEPVADIVLLGATVPGDDEVPDTTEAVADEASVPVVLVATVVVELVDVEVTPN